MFKHKSYTLGFKVYGQGVLDHKYAFISTRYCGKGRPKKIDYDYKTILDLQKEISINMEKSMKGIFDEAKVN